MYSVLGENLMVWTKGRWRGILVVIAVAAFVATAIGLPFSPPQDDERRLWDTEFLKKRQASKTANPARKQPSYRRASPRVGATDDKSVGEMLGVTIWKLRPATSSDKQDSRLLLQEEDKDQNVEWTPERVEAETPFSTGDRVRLSIESPRDGYLYVIDREQYTDGTNSDPYLIFPTLRIRGGNNSVGAGKVIELPDRRAFLLKPMRPDYKGELLTLLVTSSPITEITVGPRIQKLDAAMVEQWEHQWSTSTERFEMVGGVGKTYTKAEKEAGTEGRLLTQEDELPQTLFRVLAKPGSPLFVAVPLKINK
jgi:hypothetical protein